MFWFDMFSSWICSVLICIDFIGFVLICFVMICFVCALKFSISVDFLVKKKADHIFESFLVSDFF